MTLADKSRAFVERVQARHNRWGLTADSRLRVAGDVSSNQPISTDNDGLWTAMYVAAECFVSRSRARPMRASTPAPGCRPSCGWSRSPVSRDSPRARSSKWASTNSRATANGTTRGPTAGAGRATRAPTRSSATSSSIRSTPTSWPTPTRRPAPQRGDRPDHASHPRPQLSAHRRRWTANALGLVGAGAIWDDPDETGLRALHILSHLRVALHITRERRSRAKFQAAYDTLIYDHMLPLADAQPEDHGARVTSITPTTSSRFCRTTRCSGTRRTRAPRRSTARASSAAGGSSGRSAIRSGT